MITNVQKDGDTGKPKSAEIAISVENLTVSYGPVPALLDINLSIQVGQLVGVLGPNGSGKSTLVKSMLGFVKPDVGHVFLFGEDASTATGRVAYVPQRGDIDLDFPITVREVAVMGRYGQRAWWQNLTREDYAVADRALAQVRMEEFARRQIGQLSGGQQQRVFMARALAQDADVLLLDEPFSGVDAATERAILDVLQQAKQRGKTVVVVHHDLATAAEFFDVVALLKQRLYAFGRPRDVLDPELLCELYEGNLRVFAELTRKSSRVQHRSPDGNYRQ